MKPQDTYTETTEIVLPNDTNPLGNLMGGRLLHLMDLVAAIASQKLARNTCVTVAVNNVSFNQPIRLGNVVTLTAKVVRTFRTSMEVHVEVWSQNFNTGTRYKCNDAFFTMVAISDIGRPIEVPQIEPETDEEQKLSHTSLIRRQLKLLMADKITLKEAPELKEMLQGHMDRAEE